MQLRYEEKEIEFHFFLISSKYELKGPREKFT